MRLGNMSIYVEISCGRWQLDLPKQACLRERYGCRRPAANCRLIRAKHTKSMYTLSLRTSDVALNCTFRAKCSTLPRHTLCGAQYLWHSYVARGKPRTSIALSTSALPQTRVWNRVGMAGVTRERNASDVTKPHFAMT